MTNKVIVMIHDESLQKFLTELNNDNLLKSFLEDLKKGDRHEEYLKSAYSIAKNILGDKIKFDIKGNFKRNIQPEIFISVNFDQEENTG